jgi:hypothetical protein
MKWPKWLCESDNVTLCPFRLFMGMVATVYHAGAGYMVFGQHQTITMDVLGGYAQHMLTIGGTMAGGIGAKALLKGDAPSAAAPTT